MSGRRHYYPSFTQRNPLSLVLFALAPITFSLSLATVAHAQEKQSKSRSAAQEEASDAEDATKVKELRVAPLDMVEYPDDRPQWVESVSDMESSTHSLVAVSQPSETIEESLASLDMMRRIAVRLYANKLILSDGHHEPFVLDEDWITDNVDRFVAREYQGTLSQGDTELYENAVELQFTPKIRDEIRLQWKNAEVRNRLGALGFIVFVGTVLTGCGSATLGIFSRRIERDSVAN